MECEGLFVTLGFPSALGIAASGIGWEVSQQVVRDDKSNQSCTAEENSSEHYWISDMEDELVQGQKELASNAVEAMDNKNNCCIKKSVWIQDGKNHATGSYA